MSRGPKAKILDLDFSFLDALPEEDRFPALLDLSYRNRGTWLEISLLIDGADNPVLLEKLRQTKAPIQSSSNTFQIGPSPTSDLSYIRERLWDSIIPEFVKKDRRRVSDHRQALAILRRYHEELESAGFDPYADGSFTNILKIPRAIESHEYCQEVFIFAVQKKTRPFAAYASGTSLPAEIPTTLKEYIHVLNMRF